VPSGIFLVEGTAGKLAYKLPFNLFKAIFTVHPRIFRLQKIINFGTNI
jgi:hypothetical protein